MSDKKFTIDGVPVTPQELIYRACDIDNDFASSWLHFTSQAANVLRNAGHHVGHATYWQRTEEE